MLKRLVALLFLLELTSQQDLCIAKDRHSGLESMGILQETTCVRRLTEPDIIPNPRLFRALKNVYLYNPADAHECNIDTSRSRAELKHIGINIVSREVGLKQGVPWIDYETRPQSSGHGYNCVLTVSDVITVQRQPTEKYRLIWWCRHLRNDSPQEAFDKLNELLIADLAKANNR